MNPIGRSLHKNIWREIRSTMGRFVAIFAISALGAGFFAGLRATSPDMRATADRYYKDQNLMDYRLLSTFGFTEEDIDALRERPEVRAVMAGYGMDILAVHPEGTEVVHLSSLPENPDAPDAACMNRPVLVEGRLPTAPDECLADDQSNYRIGDVIALSDENDEDTLELMAQRSFTVVGRAQSPRYVSFQRGNTNIGSGRVSFFLYLTADAFDSEFYTEVFLVAAGAEGLSSFSDEYQTLVDGGQESLEAFGEERAQIRYDDIYGEAIEELADAKQELADGRAEADEELAEAWQEIEDAQKEIADGWEEYRDGKQKLADAERELADAEKTLADVYEELRRGQEQYDAGLAEYNSGKAQYDENKAKADQLRAGVDGVYGLVTQSLPGLNPTVPADQPQIEAIATAATATMAGVAQVLSAAGQTTEAGILYSYSQNITDAIDASDYTTAYALLAGITVDGGGGSLWDLMNGTVAAMEQQLAEAHNKLLNAESELSHAKEALDEGWMAYNAGLVELEEARAEIADAKKELADAYVELMDAEAELADGIAEYEDAKNEVEEELADAEREIADAEAELADLEKPEWYVFTRDDNPGYSGYASDTSRIDAIALVVPAFFFLVSALVCLTTMTRMVEEQRTQIGTFKAMGYSRGAIAFKYLFYAAFASTTGSVLGVFVGFILFPMAIWEAYGMMYIMPSISLWGNWSLGVFSVVVGVACTTLATWAACANELRSVPASLMRPRAPRAGKRVLLERIGPLWRRMNFMMKVTARNLFRYKKRFFMTVIGVAGCSALLLTGFGLRDSITGIVSRQYGDINLYDMAAAFTESSSSTADTDLNKVYPQYGEGLYTGQTLVTVSADGSDSGDMTVYLFVPEKPENIGDFISLHERKGGEAIAFPSEEGVVVTEKLADKLGLAVGDEFLVGRTAEDPVPMRVAGITENYVYNYIYLSPAQFEAAFGEEPEYDTLLLNLHEGLGKTEDEILSELVAAKPVAGAMDVPALREQFDDMFESLNAVIWLIIAAAALLAFVVLYNLTNINITERSREIATLKVLGFYNGEVASYVFRENLILTLIGALAGLVLGVFLHDFVIITAEVDEVMFRRTVEFLSYIYSVAFTLLTAFVVNLVMTRRLSKVNMVESLKSNE